MLVSGNNYESLIQAMITLERQPQQRLQEQRSTLQRQRSVMSDLSSRVSAFNRLTTEFTDPLSRPLRTREVTGGNKDAFTVTAGSTAPVGSHTLQIERLASTDNRLSRQFSATGSDLRSFFDTNGEQTFEISLSTPTSDNQDARTAISVTVNPTGTTNREIMGQINQAIADAMASASVGGTIRSTQRATGAVLSETSDTTRLSIRSSTSGYRGRLDFSDSANGLLSLLEVNNNAVASGTGGGQVKAVGSSESTSNLTARFTLDGVTMLRNSNTVTDALPGLTLSLTRAGDAASDFNVGVDLTKAEDKIKDFIAKYNDVAGFIAQRSIVDGKANTRGELAGDNALTNLRLGLRTDMIQSVAGQPAELSSLGQLGIELDRDGRMTLRDSTKLREALSADLEAVESLFSGPSGFATRVKTRLDAYTGTSGLFRSRERISDNQLRTLDRQILDWDGRLDRRETELRNQFARVQDTITRLQGQQQSWASFYGGLAM